MKEKESVQFRLSTLMSNFRQSQISVVERGLQYLGLDSEDVRNLSYTELEQRLKDFNIPEATRIELWSDGSNPLKMIVKNTIKSELISRVRFVAMVKQYHSLTEKEFSDILG